MFQAIRYAIALKLLDKAQEYNDHAVWALANYPAGSLGLETAMVGSAWGRVLSEFAVSIANIKEIK